MDLARLVERRDDARDRHEARSQRHSRPTVWTSAFEVVRFAVTQKNGRIRSSISFSPNDVRSSRVTRRPA
jgi:hypothetical protein